MQLLRISADVQHPSLRPSRLAKLQRHDLSDFKPEHEAGEERRPERDRYIQTARKLVDCSVWAGIIARTELERLMGKEAKDELRRQMQYQPDRVDPRQPGACRRSPSRTSMPPWSTSG